MACAEGVVLAFATVQESTEAVTLADLVKRCAVAPSEEFVHVALVSHIEYEAIFRCAEHAVQADRQLDDAEIGADVSTVLRGG